MLNGENVFSWIKVVGVLIVTSLIAFILYKIYQTAKDASVNVANFASDTWNSATQAFKNSIGDLSGTANQMLDNNIFYQLSNAPFSSGNTWGTNIYDISHDNATEENFTSLLEANPFTYFVGKALSVGSGVGKMFSNVVTPSDDDYPIQISDIQAP